jgi:hypothetical protein
MKGATSKTEADFMGLPIDTFTTKNKCRTNKSIAQVI